MSGLFENMRLLTEELLKHENVDAARIMFTQIAQKKDKLKKRQDILEFLKSFLRYFGIPELLARYYLLSYVLNFRKDGDYSSLTPENYISPLKMKGRTTPNTLADQYSKAKLPFKGSNLQGLWRTDDRGVPYYVVYSYGWYPIYIFKEDKWYEVTKRYSSSTGRQMRNVNPVRWDEELEEEVYLLSPEEMKLLDRGMNHEEVMKHKLKTLKSKEPELVGTRMKTVKPKNYWFDEEERIGPVSIKFKINSIDLNDDIATINIDVHDVLELKNGKQIPTEKNYLKGEIPDINVEKVENSIIKNIKSNFRDYIGKRYDWSANLPKGSKIQFKFNHLKK